MKFVIAIVGCIAVATSAGAVPLHAGATAVSCKGKPFGHAKVSMPAAAKPGEPHRPLPTVEVGLAISSAGMFVNGRAWEWTVDLETAVAEMVVLIKDGAAPGKGYVIDASAPPVSPGWTRWHKKVTLSSKELEAVVCRANALWSHRSRWEIQNERQQARFDVQLALYEKRSRQRAEGELHCERQRSAAAVERCWAKLPALPQLEVASSMPPAGPDPELFVEATDVESAVTLRDRGHSRSFSELGWFAGKTAALYAALRAILQER